MRDKRLAQLSEGGSLTRNGPRAGGDLARIWPQPQHSPQQQRREQLRSGPQVGRGTAPKRSVDDDTLVACRPRVTGPCCARLDVATLRRLLQLSLKDTLTISKRNEKFQALFHIPTTERIQLEVACVIWLRPFSYVQGTLFISTHLLCFIGWDHLMFVWPLAGLNAELVRVSSPMVTPRSRRDVELTHRGAPVLASGGGATTCV